MAETIPIRKARRRDFREIDRWADSITARQCNRETFKIDAPTCDDKCIGKVNWLIKGIDRVFGGSTIYKEAEGHYYAKDTGQRWIEPIQVIEVGHCATPEQAQSLRELLTEYAVKAKQYAIAISTDNSKIWVMKTENLVPVGIAEEMD